ncbi:MAG: metallophosphoesterase [Anaerolineae bacterium]|nr:metallophosphoesterase [Anaerolineae bacterium]
MHTSIGCLGLALGGYQYATRIEPGWLQVTHHNLQMPRLPRAFHGYRLVQISDIHMDPWMTAERLNHVVETVNDLAPDSIAITGDFITEGIEGDTKALLTGLRNLHAKDARVAVLGNHDHWADASKVRNILVQSGVANVSNNLQTVRRGDHELHLAGVDDVWEGKDRLDLVLEMLPEDGCAILLAHEPDFADTSAACGRFDLQLSGHSHGGQVILPIHGPPYIPAFAQKYPMGLYQIGAMLQYTNRGVGMVGLQLRFNCRPEISVFTLETPPNL